MVDTLSNAYSFNMVLIFLLKLDVGKSVTILLIVIGAPPTSKI